jgi:hypothetical protein
MRRLSPLEQLAKAEEQRALGRERLRQRLVRSAARPLASGGPKEVQPKTAAPTPEIKSTEPHKSYLDARCDEKIIGLSRSEDGPLLTPDSALTGLTNALLDAADSRRNHAILIWPGEPATLPVAHGLATLSRWIAGDKLGIRSLWYPVTTHFFHPLHDYYLDEAALYALAQELLESPATSNPRVVRSCASKDPLLFAIHAAEAKNGNPLRPTLGELIPHFMCSAGADEWTPAGQQYLSDLINQLDSRGRKSSVRAIGAFLGDPERAPDAIFGLHFNLRRRAIARHLGWLARYAPPEVIILPITRNIRARMPSWVAAVQTFRLQLARTFPTKPPGIVLITDEPTVHERLVKYLSGAQSTRKNREKTLQSDVVGSSLLWPQAQGDGLIPTSEPRIPEILPRAFDTRVVDRASSQVLGALDRIMSAEDVTAEAKQSLRDAVRFLSVLSTMCGTRADLTAWINSSTDSERLSENNTWLPYANRIRQLLDLGDLGSQRTVLEQALQGADRLWEASERGSPMLHEIEAEVR